MRKSLTSAVLATIALGASPLVAQNDSGRRFVVALEGAQETQPGDPDGMGTATVRINPGQGTLCYSLNVSGIQSATAAHIHEAPAGTAGPVVLGLTAPSGGTSSGCVPVGRDEALEIVRTPENYYVNVHNPEYPGGALRGQLAR